MSKVDYQITVTIHFTPHKSDFYQVTESRFCSLLSFHLFSGPAGETGASDHMMRGFVYV